MSITVGAVGSAEGGGLGKAPLVRPASLLEMWQEAARSARVARETGVPRGPVTGFSEIDRTMGGALEVGVHVVHGGPGSGKSAFCLQVAAQCGYECLLVTVEMSPLELLRRTTARVTDTYLGRLKSGELSVPESLALARRGLDAIPRVVFMDATRQPAPAAWILEAAREIRGRDGGPLIVVDSVHAWVQGVANEAAEYEALTQGVQALQQIAASLRVPVLAVSERNRAGMQSGGVSAGAGSRKLEYGAESVLELDRDKEGERFSGGDEARVRVKLSKNRHGSIGRPIILLFHGATQRFAEGERVCRD